MLCYVMLIQLDWSLLMFSLLL